MSNYENRYWQDVAQDKKVPRSSSLHAGGGEESDSVYSSNTLEEQNEVEHNNPPDEVIPRPGLVLKNRGPKRNLRNYKTTSWNLEEKKIILFCHTYSRYKEWGRNRDRVFEGKISESELPDQKKDATTTSKLCSIVSQIKNYLAPGEIMEIKQRALTKAQEDFQLLDEEEKIQYGRGGWSKMEKWTLLWAIEYAKYKYNNQREGSKHWYSIFKHHCPNKKYETKTKLTTQKNNIIKSKIFTPRELNEMKHNVQDMINRNICPLTNPLETPIEHCDGQVTHQSEPAVNRENANAIDGPQQQIASDPDPPSSPSSSSESEPDANNNIPDVPSNRRRPSDHSPPPPTHQDTADPHQMQLEDELANTIEEVKRMTLNERPKLIKLFESKAFKQTTDMVNRALNKLVPRGSSLTELNSVSFGAGLYVQRKTAPWYKENSFPNPMRVKRVPAWKSKLTKRLNILRKETSQLTQFMQNPLNGGRLERSINKIKRKYSINWAKLC